MKKNILKAIACICLIGLVWSCTTENDVQMHPDSTQTQLKSGSIWDGAIGVDLGEGDYRIAIDESVLAREIERISEREGDRIKIISMEIVDISAVNDPTLTGIALKAGTGDVGVGSKTMSFQLVKDPGGYLMLLDPAGIGEEWINGDGPGHISCRGCGQGCFLEYYKIDGLLIGHCVPAGCGAWCEKIKR